MDINNGNVCMQNQMKTKWMQNYHIYDILYVIDECIMFKSFQLIKIYVLKALSTMRMKFI